MKTISPSVTMKKFHLVIIFITSAGLSYSLAHYHFTGEVNSKLAVIMLCLFVISFAAYQRMKFTK